MKRQIKILIPARHVSPSMQVFFSICKYLRVTPTGFFDSDDDRPEHTTLIMDNISSLPEEKLRLVEDMVKMLK